MRVTNKKIIMIMAAVLVQQAQSVEPLVEFEFEDSFKNSGTLQGIAECRTFAVGEEPFMGGGPFGSCIDLTAARRHGGKNPQDSPSGGAVVYNSAGLNELQSFTIVVWARQSARWRGGSAARLLHKKNAWDLIPHTSGMTLSLGSGEKKVSYMLRCGTAQRPSSGWNFFAVSVTPHRIKGYKSQVGEVLQGSDSLQRRESFDSGRGELEIGNFNGIRPFNGWIDRLRIFDVALEQEQIEAIFETDVGQASLKESYPVYAMKQERRGQRKFELVKSSIPFSTRWQKRDEAHAVMQSFHATHCLWVYGTDTSFIQRVKESGVFYQGALNGLQGLEQATTNRSACGDNSGRHEDLDGNKNMPVWMATFSGRHFTGCCNNLAFQNLFFRDAKVLVDAGVDSIHIDDWGMNGNWAANVNGGVCFCDVCRLGFREWLKQKHSVEDLKRVGIDNIDDFDYRQHLKAGGIPDAQTYRHKLRELPLTPLFIEFQIESTRKFYTEFRNQLDSWSPDKYIPVSINAQLIPRQLEKALHIVDIIDFLDGESSQSADFQDTNSNILAAKMASAIGIPHIVSPIPLGTAWTRASIATAYALGQLHLVPWDIYMGSDASGSQPRYFGTWEQYGDLYDFIHEKRGLLDDFVAVAETGVLVNCDEPHDYTKICAELIALQIPFHIIPVSHRYAQIPLRSEELDGLRLVINISPESALVPADQVVLNSVRDKHLLRVINADVKLDHITRQMNLNLLRVEGPENIFAFLRINKQGNRAVIHLVNWNFGAAAERTASYANVTLSLLHPERWGGIGSFTLHELQQEARTLDVELHTDCIRIPISEMKTWCMIEIQFLGGAE